MPSDHKAEAVGVQAHPDHSLSELLITFSFSKGTGRADETIRLNFPLARKLCEEINSSLPRSKK